MKKLLLAVAAIFLFAPITFGQSNAEEVDYFQSIFGAEKKIVVSSFVTLDGEAKDAFWALYDEYETARKSLGKSRLALLEKYAKSYETITDEQTDELIVEMTKQMKSSNKLIDSYYKKIKKASGSKPAAQFFHLEHFFLAAIRLDILDNIPVIGEFGN